MDVPVPARCRLADPIFKAKDKVASASQQWLYSQDERDNKMKERDSKER